MQEDIALATDAMNKLQGAVLPSSERGGIRIEYARSKMADSVSLRLISDHDLRVKQTTCVSTHVRLTRFAFVAVIRH